jgi:YD repeat-containing protein
MNIRARLNPLVLSAFLLCTMTVTEMWFAAVAHTPPNYRLQVLDTDRYGILTCDEAYAEGRAAALAVCAAKGVVCQFQTGSCQEVEDTGFTYIHCAGCPDYVVNAYCRPAAPLSSLVRDAAGHLVCERDTEMTSDTKLGCDAGGSPKMCNEGNPIHPGYRAKLEVNTDYAGSGPFPLVFRRYYVSGAAYADQTTRQSTITTELAQKWSHTFFRSIRYTGAPSKDAFAYRPDRRVLWFSLVNGLWTPEADTLERLEQLVDAGGAPAGWRLTGADNLVEDYDAAGRLQSISNTAGLKQTVARDDSGRISTISDDFGNALKFTYRGDGLLDAMTDPAGGKYQYNYAPVSPALTSVTFPDLAARTFLYNEPGLAVDPTLPAQLTGIVDENKGRFATYTYDGRGAAVSSEHALGAGRVTLVYSGVYSVQTQVTDALGGKRTYSFDPLLGMLRNTRIADGPCPSCGPAATTYTATGFLDTTTDWKGNRSSYTYNARGLETKRVEGLASDPATPSATRTITTEWDANYRLPTSIAEPNRITTMTYGAPTDPNPGRRGNLIEKKVQATADANGGAGFDAVLSGTVRTWAYTYNANGQVLTVTGPRADTTTYTYFGNATSCTTTVAGASTVGCRGQVNTTANALGHVTTISEYNAHGQPLRITDPNGLVTTLAYDQRMRLTSRQVGAELTAYTYDAVGQLIKLAMPDGSFVLYTYDAAHRLTQIADNFGNTIAYELDAMGNRTKEEVKVAAGTPVQARNRVYDTLNRLQQEIGGLKQTTAYGYDPQGNLTTIDRARAGTIDRTLNTYDALNRLIAVKDPAGQEVTYTYNGRDQIISVKDPRNPATTYVYDGLDNLVSQSSPDTGVTNNTYDAAGNVLKTTDAKGQEASYTYDALNRVTKVEYRGGSPLALQAAYTYTYDEGAGQKGRLTTVTEPNNITTTYGYDPHGRLTRETRTINLQSYTTNYVYDAFGRLGSIAYPGGRQVNYAFDGLGRIESVITVKNGVTQAVVTGVAYRPFGPAQGYYLGNGPQTYTRTFDLDGRITSYTVGSQTVPVSYDDAGRIVGLGAATYGYDVMDRLLSFVGSGVSQSFAYDAVGNRTSKTVGPTTSNYTYAALSNRLTDVAGIARTYDANGSSLTDGANTFSYDTRGRMTRAVSSLGTTDYTVNAVGQRIRKTNPQGDTIYHYDSQGRLISETTATNGAVRKEYIYLGDIPVAIIDPSIAGSTTATTPTQPSYSGQAGTPVTLTANVAGNSPAGTVTFREGAIVLGTATVSNGSASLTLATLALGQHTVTATYSGDANNAPSTGTMQVVIYPLAAWLLPLLELILD